MGLEVNATANEGKNRTERICVNGKLLAAVEVKQKSGHRGREVTGEERQ